MHPNDLQLTALRAALAREDDPEQRETLQHQLAALLADRTRTAHVVPAADTRSI